MEDQAISSTRKQILLGGRELELGFLDQTSGIDRQSLLLLHRLVFGSNADDDWFEWKYPSGRGVGVGLWDGAEMIAFCGGIGRDFLEFGKVIQILQVGDVMVAPEWRGLLTRNGPFVKVCNHLYTQAIGASMSYRLGFGFPNFRHMRLAEKSRLAWHAADVYQLTWDTGEERDSGHKFLQLKWVDTLDKPTIEQAWANMRGASNFGQWVIGDRSWNHIRWRYLDRPDKGYRFAILRRCCSPSALDVLVFSRDAPGHWLDWIGAPQRIALGCRAACALLAEEGTKKMYAWCSPAIAGMLDGTVALENKIIASIGVPRTSLLPEAATKYPFWLMGGDTDFL